MRLIISAGTIAILGSGALGHDVRPMMDCKSCTYRNHPPSSGEHCYMFRDKPRGTRCGAFKQRDGRPRPQDKSDVEIEIIASAVVKRIRRAEKLRARNER